MELNEQNLLQLTQLLLAEYYRLFGQIRRALSDTRNGKFNEMIPKQQLRADLLHIKQLLKATQALPIDPAEEDAMHIIKFSQVKTALHNRRILVEVAIPIAEREEFRLYKAIPIPIKLGSSQVITTAYSTFFLLNMERTKYIPMTQQQLNNGKRMTNNEMLYKPTATTILSSNDICE